MTLLLRYAARSDVGLLREGNEDSGYAGPRLLAVADGMGGHAGGEVASAVAVAALAPLDGPEPASPAPEGTSDLRGRLVAAVEEANAHLRRIAESKPELEGMGTTVTALLRDGDRLGVAHIGDSRGYLLRDGTLRRITRDHTLVQSLVDEGRISADQAEQHPQRSLLTRALDGRPDVEPDLEVLDLVPGDRFLLCSDGLSGVVSEESMQRVLTEVPDPPAACESLIDLALRAGGPDNITCVVADVIDAGDDAAQSTARTVVGSAKQAVRPAPAGGGGPVAPAAAVEGSDGGAPLPRGPRPRRPGRVLLLGLVLLGLAAGGGVLFALYGWSQQQYYVGSDEEHVAIYRGLSPGIAGSLLSSRLERRELPLSALPPQTRDRLDDTIPAEDLEDARQIVVRLEAQALACATPAASSTPAPAAGAPTSSPPTLPPRPSSEAAPLPAAAVPCEDAL